MLTSIALEPNLWPTSAVLDWLALLQRESDLPRLTSRIDEARQILRSRLNFQGTHMGLSNERNDALWWLMVSGDNIDICDYDPGFEIDATITTSLRTMTEIWRGDRPWSQALKAGLVTVDGPTAVSRDVPAWLGQSTLAGVPRPA